MRNFILGLIIVPISIGVFLLVTSVIAITSTNPGECSTRTIAGINFNVCKSPQEADK